MTLVPFTFTRNISVNPLFNNGLPPFLPLSVKYGDTFLSPTSCINTFISSGQPQPAISKSYIQVTRQEILHSSRQEGVSANYFSYFCTKTYVVGTHQKRLAKVLLMSTQNIGFHAEIKKKISALFSWKKCLIWSYGTGTTHQYF